MPSRGRVTKREAVDVEDIAVSFRHDRSFVDAQRHPGRIWNLYRERQQHTMGVILIRGISIKHTLSMSWRLDARSRERD